MGVIHGIAPLPPRSERYELLTSDVVETADVCVIGSGAGGAVITRELAAGGKSVVLLERGGYYEGRDMNQRDTDMLPLLWKNAGLNFDDNLSIAIAQGECLGGSTIINDAVCFDTPDRVRSEWKALGMNFTDEEWSEHTAHVNQTLHVSPVTEAELNRNNRMLREGARKIGLREHAANSRNCVNCRQCGFCHCGCHYDTKQNVLVTFLHEALGDPRSEVRIYCNCEAETLRVANGRVVGVEGEFRGVDGKERFRIRVNARTVVVAAGAIASSFLLLKNRIASKTAGRGVCLHPAVLVVGQFPYEVKPNQGIPMAYTVHDFGVIRTQELTRQEYGIKEGEFLIEGISLPMLQFAMGMPGSPDQHHAFLQKFNNLAIAGIFARDGNLGRVSISPTKRLSFNYALGPTEIQTLASACAITGKMWFALGAERVASRHPAVPFLDRPADIEKLTQAILTDPKRMKLASAHPQSGNRIGTDPSSSTVDPDCRVHGLSNLFVCDASVFPTAVGVNPQVSVMVVASMAAARMLRDWDQRYAGIAVSQSTGLTGSIAHPMYFRIPALAQAFTEAKNAKGLESLLGSADEKPTADNWSFDPDAMEITNDSKWRSFFARDDLNPAKPPLYQRGFWRRFEGTGATLKGTTRPMGTDLRIPLKVSEREVVPYGKCLVVEHLDPKYARQTELLKFVDDRHILGRIFEGPPGPTGNIADFALTRTYPFELMTPEDHDVLFQGAARPDGEQILGVWEGQLVAEGGWSAPLFQFRFYRENGVLKNEYRFGTKVAGTGVVNVAPAQLEMREESDGFRNELRMVNAEWMVGNHFGSPDRLAAWLPPNSSWVPVGASADPVRLPFVLRRIADPEAYMD